MFESVILILVGVLISGVGYLIKRFIEKKPESEVLEKHKKLLEINKQMTEQRVSIEDLRLLEAALTGKAEAIASYSKIIESNATPLLEAKGDEPVTQAEMNMVASDNLDAAKDRMTSVLGELLAYLDGEERAAFVESQRAWENYCLEQAEASAISHRGGSIYPLIFFSELELLTVDRAARLQVELDQLRRLRGESPNSTLQATPVNGRA